MARAAQPQSRYKSQVFMGTIILSKPLFMGVDSFEEKLGLKRGFFDKLQKEDDWSFIIKLHALFEAVCTQLLIFHLSEDKLSEVFSKLELSNRSIGKIVFLKEMELIGKDDRKFIYSLSELRNQLVHNVANCEFSLKEMVAKFTPSELKQFTKTFSPFESVTVTDNIKDGLVEVDEKRMSELMERAKEQPKLHIWVGAHNVLVSLGDNFGYSDYKQSIKAKQILYSEGE